MPSPAPNRSPLPSPASSRPPSISVQSPLQLTPHNPNFPSSVHSSRQNSLEIPLRATSPRPSKRNRSALRQFYGLSATTGEVLPELDRDGFDANAYVEKLLAEKGLRKLLAVENGLVNDIRGLDGERKALVYDNYSKLIAATDTIRKMRASMEPLTPTTNTLEPAVSHIEGVSRGLVEGMRAASPGPGGTYKGVETVKWALKAPEKIRELVKGGEREEAEKVWERLKGLCQTWEGTKGVEEVKKRGEQALKGE
ncbi:Vps51/Vps67-domain-containing protein [Sphaerosporella brunnea]|uniref:Vacuolar protein sorting-associated protein 51 homolog n=1 Tax=Sphaerosporella brunnea TaxID=1250544 RepID=A0A5J5FBF7_9PEZI|nr:Vps51/Vps67-domain-containing protein [Sphaerosporella brunnea]